jgi:hypothetical protein
VAAVRNALEHYRVDEVLISTLAGEKSKWLEEGLIDDVRALTDKPVEHVESGEGAGLSDTSAPPQVAVGAGQASEEPEEA